MLRNDWAMSELEALYEMPLLELVFQSASVHRAYHNSKEIQLCHLVSVKTGGCSEDCKYCAQSSRYQTSVKPSPMMTIEEVSQRIVEAKAKGASRICLGAAWRKARDSKQFETILEMIRMISREGLEACCTLGMLTDEQAKKLKEAGLYAYNHNLDTSDRYYDKVISTRSYTDRLKTLGAVRSANLTVCCGGIIGLGESKEDRLRLIQTLSSFAPHPESVPINRLIAIPGTPLEKQPIATIWELIRMIAICRIAMPASILRIAAGREKMSQTEQALCFLAGANSIFVGEKLLTAPNKKIDEDEELLQALQLEPRKASSSMDEQFMKKALQKREEQGLKRSLRHIEPDLIDLTSNDYLGLARSHELNQSIDQEYASLIQEPGIRPYVGATGSRLLTGNSAYAEYVEEEVASFHKAPASLIYSSGYVANIGLLSCISSKEDAIVIDAQVHASTWEGVSLSGSKAFLFKHNDLDHLEMQIKKAKKSSKRVFVCVEALYSMSGDLAPLVEITQIIEKYAAYLIVDEAHSTGVLGAKGEGLVASLGLEDRVFARIHTFGKALGIHGAAVVGSQTLKEFLVNFSKPFIYTTAFPLRSYVSIMKVYEHLRNSNVERANLQSILAAFKSGVAEKGLPIRTTNTPIQSLPVASAKEADLLSLELLKRKVDIRAIKPPTVRRGQESLRVCLHAFNTVEEVELFLNFLSQNEQHLLIA